LAAHFRLVLQSQLALRISMALMRNRRLKGRTNALTIGSYSHLRLPRC